MQRITRAAATMVAAGALLFPTTGIAAASDTSGGSLWRGENPPVKIKVKQSTKKTKVRLKKTWSYRQSPRILIRYVVKKDSGKKTKTKRVRLKTKKRIVKLPARTVKVLVKLPGAVKATPYFKTSKPLVERAGSGGSQNGSRGSQGSQEGDGGYTPTYDPEAEKAAWTCREPMWDMGMEGGWERKFFSSHCGIREGMIGGTPLLSTDTDPGPAYTKERWGSNDCYLDTPTTVKCWQELTFDTDEWTRFGRTDVVIGGVPVTSQDSVTVRFTFTPERYEVTGNKWWANVGIPDGLVVGSFLPDPVGNQHRPPHWEATQLGLPAGSRIPVVFHNGHQDIDAYWAGTSLAHQLGAYVIEPPGNCGIVTS